MKKILIFPVLILLLFASCSEKEVTIGQFEIPDTDRVVLIEEFTGIRCAACPRAASEIASIMETFTGNVVAVAVHSDYLATPEAESKFDFRSQLSNDIEAYLLPYDGKPAASINRKHFENEENLIVQSPDKWANIVRQELLIDPKVEVQVINEFDPTTRVLNSKIEISPLENIQGEFTLTVFITENHINDYQKDIGAIYPDYEHKHVLKVKLNDNLKGDPLDDTFTIGDIISKSYIFTLPEADISGPWIPENCSVIAFVSEIASGSKEVLQARESRIVE